jgi:hypothetical protein
MSAAPSRFKLPIPSPGECVFAVVLGLVLLGGRQALLNDPGTPWHLRLGREILATRSVPHHDTLTFMREHAEWVDQSWAFDALLALVVDSWGWSAAIALAALGLAALFAALARDLVRDGTSPVVAVVVTLLAMCISSIHFLLRPHLFTFAFVYLTFRSCLKQHRQGGWEVAVVPLYTAILANLHGGFVALPVIVLTAAVGHVLSGSWDAARRRNTAKFGVALIACCLAALANPYGMGLYAHVIKLLFSSGVTSLIIEYQPPAFGKSEAEVLELVLLGLVALPVFTSRRLEKYQLVHLLVWMHLALTSIRNAPLFAFALAPALATLIDGLPLACRNSWKSDAQKSFLPRALATAVLLLVMFGVKLGGFNEEKWPLGALATLNAQPTSARLFHEQDWGGLIAAECQPARRSYLDDRFELFGKEAILEYVDVLTGGPVWDSVRDRDKIDLVWLRPERKLATRLLKDGDWEVVYYDQVSIMLRRAGSHKLAAR